MKAFLATWLGALLLSAAAHASDAFPNQTIRILVGFPPGGGADNIARMLADHMGKTLTSR